MKNILKNLVKIISYQPNPDRESFVLRENEYDRKAMQSGKKDEGRDSGRPGASGGNGDQPPGADDPGSGPAVQPGVSRRRPLRKAAKAGQKKDPDPEDGEGRVSSRLDRNRKKIEEIYGLPANRDIVLREFTLGTDPPLKAFMVYIDGLADRATQVRLLQDLMIFAGVPGPGAGKSASLIMKKMLPGSQVKLAETFEEVVYAVNYGDTAFFFDGSGSALVVETKGWDKRAVGRPETEQTVTGPQEAFVENLRSNTALIRRIVRSEKLYTEFFQVGTRIKSDAAVMYLKDLANPDLVAEVKRRISGVKADFVTDVGMLEQYIEDNPYNLNPQTMITEKPDRVAAALAEGRVAVLLSGSPFSLVVPVSMYTQLHTGEETYLRWQYGTFLRLIRNFSFYLALLLPGIYLSVSLYHQEMVPTELLLAIAGNRERVPFPTIIEMLLMEFSFELVREAGLRIPGIIGSTIGIVGALILGQAAVQANIVSPILVVLVAVTGLASFSIPSFSLAFSVRIYRFFYILMGALLGFYGITIGLFMQILLTANLKSFGMPYLAPSGPRTHPGLDVIYRLPLFLQRRRPDPLNPLDDVRASGDPRGWVDGKEGGHEGQG
ncbi:MAG: spore germination protein [Peptococcaceae bacterium]|nr:spore germination protein [Peptococcaceae bacterium]